MRLVRVLPSATLVVVIACSAGSRSTDPQQQPDASSDAGFDSLSPVESGAPPPGVACPDLFGFAAAPLVTVTSNPNVPPTPQGGPLFGQCVGPYFALVSSVEYGTTTTVGTQRQQRLTWAGNQLGMGVVHFNSTLRVDQGPVQVAEGDARRSGPSSLAMDTQCPAGVPSTVVGYSAYECPDGSAPAASLDIHVVARAADGTITSYRIDSYAAR